MEFIQENYIWLIVVGAFLLMIIIGYIADRSQKFNKEKPKKEKKPVLKEKVEDEVEEEIKEPEGTTLNANPLDDFDMTNGMDNSFNDWDENKKIEPEEEVIVNEIPTMDNSFAEWNDAPVEETVEQPEETSLEETAELPEEETLNEMNEATEEPEYVETDWNNDQPEQVENLETPTEFADSLNEEEPKVPETVEQPVSEITDDETNTGIEDLEITLPSIETLNEEIKDVVDEEDVWKF